MNFSSKAPREKGWFKRLGTNGCPKIVANARNGVMMSCTVKLIWHRRRYRW